MEEDQGDETMHIEESEKPEQRMEQDDEIIAESVVSADEAVEREKQRLKALYLFKTQGIPLSTDLFPPKSPKKQKSEDKENVHEFAGTSRPPGDERPFQTYTRKGKGRKGFRETDQQRKAALDDLVDNELSRAGSSFGVQRPERTTTSTVQKVQSNYPKD